jgi:hypothetical protein
VEKCKKLHFLCPECEPSRECDLVIGELLFPDYREAWSYSFRVCWRHEICRPTKPYGWGRGRKGKVFPIRWRRFSEARRAMQQKRDEKVIDLTDQGVRKVQAERWKRRMEKEAVGGSRNPKHMMGFKGHRLRDGR